MAAINTRDYLLFQAKRRLVPTLNNLPGMGLAEKRLVAHHWKQRVPAGSSPYWVTPACPSSAT